MIRAARLAVSRPMYAFNPDTWTPRYFDLAEHERWAAGQPAPYRDRPAPYPDRAPLGGVVNAVWFRRKKGRTVASMGTYSPLVLHADDKPTDDRYLSWITAAVDNRYGASHEASWDGTALLTTDPPAVDPRTAARLVEFLDAMLKGFPDPPSGFDGWWTFEKGTAR